MRPLDQFGFLPQILEWFRTAGANYLQRTELGETYAGAKYIQEQHSQFEAEARVRHKRLEPYGGGGGGGALGGMLQGVSGMDASSGSVMNYLKPT